MPNPRHQCASATMPATIPSHFPLHRSDPSHKRARYLPSARRKHLCTPAAPHTTPLPAFLQHSPPPPHVVFITPDGVCDSPRRAAELAVKAAAGGASLIQLRDRRSPFLNRLRTAERIALALPCPRMLVINGPDSIAMAAQLEGGVGVHLRECDIATLLPLSAELGNVLVGCSVHSVDSARLACTAAQRPTYLQIGTMFATGSHPGKVPEGPRLLDDIRRATGGEVVLVGVGGITADNAGVVVGPGLADGVAVISGIATAACPEEATRSLRFAVEAAYDVGHATQ